MIVASRLRAVRAVAGCPLSAPVDAREGLAG